MSADQADSLSSDDFLPVAQEVITAAYTTRNKRPSSRALLGFAVRLAGSWRSTVTLVNNHPDEIRSIANDCAAVQRCMYDALLQMRWLAHGPNDPDEMGQLYLDFGAIEHYRLMTGMLSHDDAMSKRIADDPVIRAGHGQRVREYEAVREKFKRSGSGNRGLRKQWYPGSLADLADELGASAEYTWFVSRNNSSVHTGPQAMFGSVDIDGQTIEGLSEHILFRGLGVLVKNDGIETSEFAASVIKEHSDNPLELTFRSRSSAR